ncbi:MAG: CYTH domain-containing protein [Bacilli bacterium]
MSTNIEIEVKVLLTQTEFNKVKKTMDAASYPVVVQTNHYIDTPKEQLRRYGMALRVREIKDEFTLTLKCPLAEGLLEKSQILSDAEFVLLKNNQDFPEGDLKNFLISVGIDVEKMQILATLTTKRISLPYEDSLFSMDENHFNNHVDYELEMEGTSVSNAEAQLAAVCKQANVPFVLNSKSKQARAMDALKN